jgi:hypothetical protein
MSRLRKATREQAKLRLALIGPAGSGKTWSSLALACEIARLIRESGRGPGRVALIDSEAGSARLYANTFDFETLDLTDHSPLAYVAAIEELEREGIDVAVVDSLSHAWIGKGGALDQVDKAVERGAGNSFSAWRQVTPKHNALVEKILSCKLHLIATIRAKTEYVQEKNEKGKTEIKKLGMAAIQRDGLEYEFTLTGDLDLSNTLRISKTRLGPVICPGDVFEKPGAALAGKIFGWLVDGAPAVVPDVPAKETGRLDHADAAAARDVAKAGLDAYADQVVREVAPESTLVSVAIDEVFAAFLAGMEAATDQAALDKAAAQPGKPTKGTPQHAIASDVYRAAQTRIRQQVAAQPREQLEIPEASA